MDELSIIDSRIKRVEKIIEQLKSLEKFEKSNKNDISCIIARSCLNSEIEILVHNLKVVSNKEYNGLQTKVEAMLNAR